MTPERELLREARDALYNAFEPDNQSAIYYKIVAFFALPATARSPLNPEAAWPFPKNAAYWKDRAERAEAALVVAVAHAEDSAALLKAAQSEMGDSDTAKVPEGYRLVREDVCEFLRGASPLDGSWYGDLKKDLGDKRPFWWRKYLGIPFSSRGAPSPSAKRLPTVAEMKGILRDDYVPPSPDGNSREGG